VTERSNVVRGSAVHSLLLLPDWVSGCLEMQLVLTLIWMKREINSNKCMWKSSQSFRDWKIENLLQ